jgi:hypothetical protein
VELTNSIVRRGGVTTDWSGATTRLSATIVGAGLALWFVLPSAGGGQTQIRVNVGLNDLRPLLSELAQQHPGLADTFAECTQKAVAVLLSVKAVEQ